MTTIKRVQYPAECLVYAKEIADSYFVHHKNQLDFLSKGFPSIPTLFSFAFPKEIVEQNINHFKSVVEKIDSIIALYDTHFAAGTMSTSEEILKEFETVDNFLEVVSEAREEKPKYESYANPTLDGRAVMPFMINFIDEVVFKKSNKVLLNPFLVGSNILSNDDLIYIYKGDITYRELFTKLSAIGFIYDEANCAMKEFFPELAIEVVEPEQSVLDELYLRHELAEFIRVDDDFKMSDFIIEKNIDVPVLFKDESLVGYCIEMNKPNCFLNALFSTPSVIVNMDGKLDPAIKRAIFSVAYRDFDFNRYLGRFLKAAEFNDLSQDVIDEFVKESFHDHRLDLSLEVFNLYKDKIDPKMLGLALVRNNNVYRMEIPEMKATIEAAFANYKDDILAIPGIVSHFEYYKKTNDFIECLKHVPMISIGTKNVMDLLSEIQATQIEVLNEAMKSPDDYDMVRGKLATKVEHAQDALNLTKEHIEYFSQYLEVIESDPEIDDDLTVVVV